MCHEMLTRFAKDNGPRIASRVAKTCLLAPLPAEDQAPLRALVERSGTRAQVQVEPFSVGTIS